MRNKSNRYIELLEETINVLYQQNIYQKMLTTTKIDEVQKTKLQKRLEELEEIANQQLYEIVENNKKTFDKESSAFK